MCGRYYFCSYPIDAFQELDRKIKEHSLTLYAQHEVFPSDQAIVLVADENDYKPVVMKWGMKGYYGHEIINARMEGIAEKKTFASFYQQRCLIPCNGFFEWQPKGKSKQKVFISKKGKPLMYLAGIYNNQKEFVIITGPSEYDMKPVHDRTPLFIDQKEIGTYLSGEMEFRVDNQDLLIRKGS